MGISLDQLKNTVTSIKDYIDNNAGTEVSISQTLTSGTEIGSVTIDGAEIKLYAPVDGGGNGGSTPIGTIIPFMGNTCPKGYLVCDGTVYNISNFQKLSDFFLKEFGSTNFFGGDGVTTFAVPDLRGEFLRGAGTNSHENQGNGADVGTHQDATEHNKTYTSYQNKLFQTYSNSSTGYPNDFSNIDSRTEIDSNGYKLDITGTAASNASVGGAGTFYTSRPTNTSVLYIIKYTTEEDDASIWLGYEDYSEEEEVIGQWTDGRPLYRKICSWGKGPNSASVSKTFAQLGIANSSNIIKCDGILDWGTGQSLISANTTSSSSTNIYSNSNSIYINTTANLSTIDVTVILEYTKTTDAENSFSPSLINPKIKSDGINQITDFSNYSTDETVIGKWIDGKPIYRKVLKVKTPSNANTRLHYENCVPNINVGINICGYFKYGSNDYYNIPLSYPRASDVLYSIQFEPDKNGISIFMVDTDSNVLNKDAFVILEYTKTTDTENSFNYSMLSSATTIDEVTDSEVEEVFA